MTFRIKELIFFFNFLAPKLFLILELFRTVKIPTGNSGFLFNSNIFLLYSLNNFILN